MVFVKKSTFSSYVFFLANKAIRNIFWYSGKNIKFFGPQKWSSQKVEKKRHFAKRLVHGFCQNIELFSHIFFFLCKKSHKERFFDILDRKEYFLDLKGELLKKSKKSTVCKGVSPWYFIKNRPFPYLFFWAKKVRKKHFLIFWIEKNAF